MTLNAMSTRFVRATVVPVEPASQPSNSQPQDPELPALLALIDLARTSSPVQFLTRFPGQYPVFRGIDPAAELVDGLGLRAGLQESA